MSKYRRVKEDCVKNEGYFGIMENKKSSGKKK